MPSITSRKTCHFQSTWIVRRSEKPTRRSSRSCVACMHKKWNDRLLQPACVVSVARNSERRGIWRGGVFYAMLRWDLTQTRYHSLFTCFHVQSKYKTKCQRFNASQRKSRTNSLRKKTILNGNDWSGKSGKQANVRIKRAWIVTG